MKNYLTLILLILTFSCGSLRVSHDYDKQADFSKLKSFHFYTTKENGLSDLDNKRIVRLLTEALEAKGFTRSETPDFMISIEANEYENINQNNVGVAVGGTGGNVGGGVSVGFPMQGSRYSRIIYVDFVQENGPGAIWRAEARASYSPNAKPNAREAVLKAVVDKMLEKFPPQ